MIKAILRTTYRLGYLVAPFVWRLTRPNAEGAMVAVRSGERVLFVRNSYRPEWSLPGGGVKVGERPLDAAMRELREEIGWRIERADLVEVGDVTFVWRFRNDHATIFRFDADEVQPVILDGVEVVEARFLDRGEANARFLQPHARHFLDQLFAGQVGARWPDDLERIGPLPAKSSGEA